MTLLPSENVREGYSIEQEVVSPDAPLNVTLHIKPSFRLQHKIEIEEIRSSGQSIYRLKVVARPPHSGYNHLKGNCNRTRLLSERERRRIVKLVSKLAMPETTISSGIVTVYDGTAWTINIVHHGSRLGLSWTDFPKNWNMLEPLINALEKAARYKITPRWWQFWH